MKYTKETLTEAVAHSRTIKDVLRHFGLSLSAGGVHAYIAKRIKHFEIDTSHFLGVRANCGIRHKGGPRKRSANEVLVKKEPGSNREHTYILRRALLEIGREYKCGECGLPPEWNGKQLALQVEHKNGKPEDDRPENLEFLCPNCHTQTPTYSITKKYGKSQNRKWTQINLERLGIG
jgi:5-methylcytosine-specific restriction endonuclease McrA